MRQNNMYASLMKQDRQNFSFENSIQNNQNLATSKNQKENTEDFIRLMKQIPVDGNSSLAKEIEKIIADKELPLYTGGWTVPQENAGVQIPVEQAQLSDLYF